MANHIFELENIHVVSNGRQILSDISLGSTGGEIIGVLGPNGAGKTTMLDVIGGLRKPASGTLKIFGFHYAQDPVSIRKRTGMVHEKPILYEDLTGCEHLQFIAALYGMSRKETKTRLESLLNFFELQEFWNRPVSTYPKGIKQKLNLAGSLIPDPELLIMDEPTSSLDPRSGRIIRLLVNRYRELGRTVILSTHILEIAEALCDRVIILKDGHIVSAGATNELRSNRSLEDVFLELTHGGEYTELISHLLPENVT